MLEKFTELPIKSSISPTDILPIVDMDGTPTTKKVTVGTLLGNVITFSASITTIDATPVYIILASLIENGVSQVDVLAKTTSADANTRQVFKLSALYYGAAGPTATIDGSIASIITGTGTADITLDIDGADIRLKITGIAATTLITTYDVSII